MLQYIVVGRFFKLRIMDAKAKAKELFNKHLLKVGTNCENDGYCDRKECQYESRIVCGVDLFTAKQCALISIDEVLENVNYFFIELEKDGLPNKFTDEIEYWEVVKEEISKLLPA